MTIYLNIPRHLPTVSLIQVLSLCTLNSSLYKETNNFFFFWYNVKASKNGRIMREGVRYYLILLRDGKIEVGACLRLHKQSERGCELEPGTPGNSKLF